MKKKLQNIAVFDIETTRLHIEKKDTFLEEKEQIVFKCGVFFSETEIFRTESESEFYEFVKNLEPQKYETIFAHNGGRFDFLWLMQECFKHGDETNFSPIFINSNLSYLTFFGKHFTDSMMILPGKLDDISVSILGSKLGGKIGDFQSDNLLDYCERDCRILYMSVKSFFNRLYDEGYVPRLSLASIAFSSWKKTTEWKQNRHYIEQERECYAGGYVELFIPGEHENYTIYDVNSMYPYIMSETKIPFGPNLKIHKSSAKKYIENADYGGFFSGIIEVPKMLCSPVWKRDKKLYMGYGKIYGHYTLDELRYFQEIGCNIIDIENIVVYDRYDYLFSDFIKELWQKRIIAQNNDDSFGSLLYKLIMNSLYGKFAEREEKEYYYVGEDMFQEGDVIIRITDDGKIVGQGTEHVKLENVQPIISAYVTANARIMLHRLIMQHPKEIIYCDTDSLHTYAEYPVSKNLGDLKIEAQVEKGLYLAPKMYELLVDGKTISKMKGFMRKGWSLREVIETGQSRNRVVLGKSMLRMEEPVFSELGIFKEIQEISHKRDIENNLPFFIDDTKK